VTNEDPTTVRHPGGRARVIGLVLPSIATTVAAMLAAGPAGAGTLGLPDSATTQGDEVASLWLIFVVLAALVTLLIWALTTYVIVSSIRRRRAGGWTRR